MFQKPNLSQTGFENLVEMFASKMWYGNLNFFVNVSEKKSLKCLDYLKS